MRATNTMRMNRDGRFVIMQVSDPQDLVNVRPAMVKMLNAAYDTVRPDLVVFTGDNILGNHLLDARIGSRKVAEGHSATLKRMELSLAHILKPLEERNIPFAMIFGNHDDMNLVTKKEQADIYRRYQCCLPLNNEDEDRDAATYNIPILSADGSKTAFNLWMMDTAWYDKCADVCVEAIKEQAVAWYRTTERQLRSENGGEPVSSLLFMHIPFAAQWKLCKPCSKGTKGAVPLRDGTFICLDKTKAKGVLGEPPCVCEDAFGLFDAIKENGDVMAAVSGHDHRNCFEGTADGVRLVQTACASFRCYGNRQRGVRVFTLDENKPGTFETRMYTYDDLCGKGLRAQLRYLWDADDYEKRKIGLLAGLAGAGAVACLAAKLKK